MASKPDQEQIAGLPLFASLTPEQLDAIATLLERRREPEGTKLVGEGAPGYALCVILSGDASVTSADATLGTLGAGDFFGEISLVTERPTTASVTLTEPSSALVISRPSFRRLLLAEPGIQLQVLETLADRVME